MKERREANPLPLPPFRSSHFFLPISRVPPLVFQLLGEVLVNYITNQSEQGGPHKRRQQPTHRTRRCFGIPTEGKLCGPVPCYQHRFLHLELTARHHNESRCHHPLWPILLFPTVPSGRPSSILIMGGALSGVLRMTGFGLGGGGVTSNRGQGGGLVVEISVSSIWDLRRDDSWPEITRCPQREKDESSP
jgi:hypothetical protein